MKTSKKIISVLLAVMMILGTTSTAFAGTFDKYKTVDEIITQDSIADIAGNLIDKINNSKKDITGTVLRISFLFIKNDSLEAKIGDRDVTTLSDSALATILVSWLDENLPEWTKSLSENKYYTLIQSAAKTLLGITLNLNSTRDALSTLYDVTETSLIKTCGDLELLYKNGSSLEGIKKKSDIDVIYSLFQFLADNKALIAKAVKGQLDLGAVDTFASGTSDKINSKVNELLSKENLMDKLYKLVDGHAADGEFKNSAYASYTADQLIAAGLIRMIKNVDAKTVIISKSECDAALQLNFYGLLAKYGPEFLKNYKLKDGSSLIEKLNAFCNEYMGKLNAQDIDQDIKDRFSFTSFTDDDFNAIFDKITSDGILNQFNDICCLIAKHILSDAAYKELGLKEGTNTNLNDNFTKIFRYTLPALARIGDIGGFDFSGFKQETVDGMTLPQMGAAILKIFFPGWFKANFTDEAKDAVNNATSIDQLAVIAAKLALTNSDWIKFELSEPAKLDYAKIKSFDSENCKEAILKMGAEVAALTLDYNKSTTHFTLDANRDGWTYKNYLNAIVNWGVGFIKGLPAVIAKDTGFNNQDAFYKVNVVLNELVDFSFLDAGDTTFTLDIETLLFDKLLGNLFNLDFEGILNTFKKNENEGNILNGKIISGVISALDRIVTAMFEHNCEQTTVSETEKIDSCKTRENKYTYCKHNGHYMGTGKTLGAIEYNHDFGWVSAPGVDCKANYRCKNCGTPGTYKGEKDAVKYYPAKHNYVVDPSKTIPATATSNKFEVSVCTKCKSEKKTEIPGTMLQPENIKINTAPHIKVKNNTVVSDTSVNASAMLAASNATKAIDANGKDLTGTNAVGTGAKLVLVSGGKTVDTKEIAILGDIDGNGSITVSDARSVLRAAVNLDTLTGAKFIAADIDFNNSITVSDARSILRAAVSLDSPASWIANFK